MSISFRTRLWAFAAALAALLVGASAAHGAKIDLTKPAHSTVEFWSTTEEETEWLLVSECGPKCTMKTETGGEFCPEPPGRCRWLPLEARAVPAAGFELREWSGCPAVIAGNCHVAGQMQRPGTIETRAAVHANFRDIEKPTNIVLTTEGHNKIVILSATGQDNDAVASVDFYAGTTKVGTDSSAPFSLEWDSTTVIDGTHQMKARAFDADRNLADSPSVEVSIDNTPPVFQVVSGPGADPGTAQQGVEFSFRIGDADAATVECALDGAFGACTTLVTHKLAGVADGTHTFSVRGTDKTRNPGRVDHAFAVDTTPPETEIRDGTADGATTTESSARFEFGSEAGATLGCRLDGALLPCSSPLRLDGLTVGRHVFEVAATDRVGNIDSTPATRTWTVSAAVVPARRDADGDGYPDGVDCDDANRAINPGARDIPGNAVDEDCKDGPAPRARVAANARLIWTGRGGAVRVRLLMVADAARGTQIEVRCRSRACPFAVKRVTATRDGNISLTRLLKGRQFRHEIRLTLVMRRPEEIGRWVEFRVLPSGRLKRVERCLPPGASSPSAC